jgi:hypothetical protein
MSGTLQAVVASAVTVLLRRPRAIATIIPNVVVEEIGFDETVITDHPVEQGAPISDHAFMRPAELILKCGWSNSSSVEVLGVAIPGVSRGLASAVTGALSGDFSQDYVTEVYEKLRKLQSDRTPFTVSTGKRTYEHMLIQSLVQTTDEQSENALMVVARLREVIIVVTKTTTVPPREQHAQPERTAPVEDRGAVQPGQAQPSVLSGLRGG